MYDFLQEVDAHQLRTIAYRAVLEEVRQARVAAMLTRYRSQQLRSRSEVRVSSGGGAHTSVGRARRS